jgi:hypothetical protein
MRSHAKVAMDEVALVSCLPHAQPLKLFCHTCNRAICFECTLAECKDHQFEKAQDLIVNAMEEVKEMSTELQHLSSGDAEKAVIKANQALKGE